MADVTPDRQVIQTAAVRELGAGMREGEPERAIGLEAPLGHRANSGSTDGLSVVFGPPFRAEPEPHALYNLSKRMMDIALAAVLLVVSSPVLLAACLVLWLTTRTNPLLVQTRTGFLGREFGMLKLRTMTDDASAPPQRVRPGEILVAKAPDDDRVTTAGRVLRRTSLDELPQLVNVLLGQMSIVGPRPGLPVEVAHYPVSWHRRLGVKPGLTGLWQVSGRSDIPAWRRAAMDRYYLRHRNLGFDCAIVVRTATAVLGMRGAW